MKILMKLSIFPISLRGKHNESPTNGLVICIDFPAPEQTTPQQWVRSKHAMDRKPQPLHVHLSSFILRFSPFKDDWNWHPFLTHLVCLARQKKEVYVQPWYNALKDASLTSSIQKKRRRKNGCANAVEHLHKPCSATCEMARMRDAMIMQS